MTVKSATVSALVNMQTSICIKEQILKSFWKMTYILVLLFQKKKIITFAKDNVEQVIKCQTFLLFLHVCLWLKKHPPKWLLVEVNKSKSQLQRT